VAITKRKAAGAVLKSEMGSVNEYQFDEAFDERVSQEAVYARTAKRLIPSVLEGFNVTVFAYGATGSGKTHTMMGSERQDAAREAALQGGEASSICGIIPLTLIDIFAGLGVKRAQASLPNEQWKLFVSYLEVYNEKVRDLFAPDSYNLPVQEDPKSGIVGVGRLSSKPAKNADEVMSLLRFGNANRRTHATDANATSSRSHAVLQLLMRQEWSNSKGKAVVRESRVNLIDLAGSERAGKTNNRGIRLQEGANINRRLLALANCINALSQGRSRKNAT
jgi:kinesin family protein 18/19